MYIKSSFACVHSELLVHSESLRLYIQSSFVYIKSSFASPTTHDVYWGAPHSYTPARLNRPFTLEGGGRWSFGSRTSCFVFRFLGVRHESLWFMICGVWCMVYGVWIMDYGLWFRPFMSERGSGVGPGLVGGGDRIHPENARKSG